MTPAVGDVVIQLLGGFQARIDGRDIPDITWAGRRSRELVQLLALADGRVMLRDQVIEALWPHLDPDAGAANLRKAAHYARQALGDPEAIVLKAGQVGLFPSRRRDRRRPVRARGPEGDGQRLHRGVRPGRRHLRR